MKQLLKIVIFLLVINQAKGQQFYVSPSGNDTNNGSVTTPVASLTKAHVLIKNFKTEHPNYEGDIVVHIGEGNYELKNGFTLDDTVTGSKQTPIIWSGVNKDKVIISGGKKIKSSEFKKVKDPAILMRVGKAAATQLYQVSLKQLGITNFGKHQSYGHGQPVIPAPLEIFFNNEPLTLAHYPNSGSIKIGKVIDKGSVPRIGDTSNRGGLFEYTDTRHAKWAGQKDLWLQGTFNYGFADDNINIETIDTLKKQIKLVTPHIYGLGNGRDFQAYTAYNILEEYTARASGG